VGKRRFARCIVTAAFVAACSSDSTLKPFTSDGCSLFPDKSRIAGLDWCACCVAHDVAYWRGGTFDERKAADVQLRKCVMRKTGNASLARLMFDGVRAGGSPYFYNWYRWGYGWSYERKYQALSPAEAAQAKQLLKEFIDSGAKTACPAPR
jgi:hypothetical protein